MAIVGDEREKYRLLNNGLSAFATESGSDVHLQMAAATLTVIPILIIYLIFRKEIIRGVAKMESKENNCDFSQWHFNNWRNRD